MNLIVNGHLLLIAKNQSSLEIASITLNNEPILETIFDDAKIILGFPDVVSWKQSTLRNYQEI